MSYFIGSGCTVGYLVGSGCTVSYLGCRCTENSLISGLARTVIKGVVHRRK